MALSGGSHTVRSEAGCRNPDLYRSQTRTAPSTGVLVACPAEPHNYAPLTGNVFSNSLDQLGVATLNHIAFDYNAVAQNPV